MVFGRQVLETVVLTAGLIFLLVGSLAVPAQAQDTTSEDLTESQCTAIINNSGNQYSSTINQYCNQLLADQDEEPTDNGSTTNNGSTDGTAEETTEDDADNDADEDVIDNSVPDKDLPETGGVPLLGVAALVIAGAGLLTAVVRRRQ